MNLNLALNGFYEPSYDIAFNGQLKPKEAFRCANIDDNNYTYEDFACGDPYPAFADHISMNVLPVIQKGLNNTAYTVHSVDAEQGEIHPHLVIRRNDFAILTDKDCAEIQKQLQLTIDKNNAANRQCTNANSSSLLFANKKQSPVSMTETTPERHYDLRHK